MVCINVGDKTPTLVWSSKKLDPDRGYYLYIYRVGTEDLTPVDDSSKWIYFGIISPYGTTETDFGWGAKTNYLFTFQVRYDNVECDPIIPAPLCPKPVFNIFGSPGQTTKTFFGRGWWTEYKGTRFSPFTFNRSVPGGGQLSTNDVVPQDIGSFGSAISVNITNMTSQSARTIEEAQAIFTSAKTINLRGSYSGIDRLWFNSDQ